MTGGPGTGAPDLSDAYANAAYIPGGADYPARWAAAAARFRATHPRSGLAIPYGPSPRQVFDLFLPEGAPRGTLVFVHGGYWLAFAPSDFSHLAAGALAQGWAVALPGYDLCPAVRIAEITRQVARAIEAVAGRVAGPLVLAGHSAGGHLVARMPAPEVALAPPVRDRVLRLVPISPLADLRPLLRTGMKDDLGLDPLEAAAESPLRQPAPDMPVHVWVGDAERPAFRDQARWLADTWGAALTEEPGRHHFDVIEGLERESALLSACLDGL